MREMIPGSTDDNVPHGCLGDAESFTQPVTANAARVKSSEFMDLILSKPGVTGSFAPCTAPLSGHVARIVGARPQEHMARPKTQAIRWIPSRGVFWMQNVAPVADKVLALKFNSIRNGISQSRSPYVSPANPEASVPVDGSEFPEKAWVIAPWARRIIVEVLNFRHQVFEVSRIVWDKEVTGAETRGDPAMVADLAAVRDWSLELPVRHTDSGEVLPLKIHGGVTRRANLAVPHQARIRLPRQRKVVRGHFRQSCFQVLVIANVVTHRLRTSRAHGAEAAPCLRRGGFIHYAPTHFGEKVV